jgi:hypothetical protein
LRGATTETLVTDRHTELPQDPKVIDELFRILREHASEKAAFVDAVPIRLESDGSLSGSSHDPIEVSSDAPSGNDLADRIAPHIGEWAIDERPFASHLR